MNDAFEIGAIALNAQQRALDVIAGNIANVNTPAFKRSNVTFTELLLSVGDPANPPASLQPVTRSAGVATRSVLALGEPGEIKYTGEALDIAIAGDAFIELLGPRGRPMLWRGGGLSIQEDGLLSTIDGIPLRAMIAIPQDATDVRIDRDGLVSVATVSGDSRIELGRIELVRVLTPDAVSSFDRGYYGIEIQEQIDPIEPGASASTYIVQGGVEQSNVNLNNEMVQLMIVQRSYAANAQVVQAADQLASINNTLRR